LGVSQELSDIVLLGISDRRRVHNLKYYTWVEQQEKTFEEIQAHWYSPNYWSDMAGQAETIDGLITEFNAKTGLLSR
jgi:cysteine synthase